MTSIRSYHRLISRRSAQRKFGNSARFDSESREIGSLYPERSGTLSSNMKQSVLRKAASLVTQRLREQYQPLGQPQTWSTLEKTIIACYHSVQGRANLISVHFHPALGPSAAVPKLLIDIKINHRAASQGHDRADETTYAKVCGLACGCI